MKRFLYLMLAVSFIMTSCRTEDEEFINPEQDENVAIGSRVADLITRTATNDGSNDNILDNASCFSVVLPVTVFIDGLEIVVDSEDDFQTIEDVFDEFEGDIDELDFEYPITVVLSDFTEVVLNNEDELIELAATCNDDNQDDDDIECIDFQYPITYSVFNENSELIDTVTINDDAEHYAFIESLEDSDIASVNFPLTLILSDGSTLLVNNIVALEEAIENAIDDCDEDDDNDYDDDDCENCTIEQLTAAFTDCASFELHKLKRNGENLDDLYEDFGFSFTADGGIVASDETDEFEGTWAASGSGQDIVVEIEFIDLPELTDSWNLHEISAQDDEVKVDLRLSNGDRLRFKCDDDDDDDDNDDDDNDDDDDDDDDNDDDDNDDDDDDDDDDDNDSLTDAMMDGDWIVALLTENGVDTTTDFSEFTFDFDTNNIVDAEDDTNEEEGFWEVTAADTMFALEFTTALLANLNDNYEVVSVQDDRVELTIGTKTLVFEKE